MRRHLESGLVWLIALACAAFAAVLVRGPAREEETMRGAWSVWMSWWRAGDGEGLRSLTRDEVLRLPGGHQGSVVRVEHGLVVVTREGDPEDHVLPAGAELRVPGRGLAVAWALEPSRVEVRRGGAERAGERPAAARPLSVAR